MKYLIIKFISFIINMLKKIITHIINNYYQKIYFELFIIILCHKVCNQNKKRSYIKKQVKII